MVCGVLCCVSGTVLFAFCADVPSDFSSCGRMQVESFRGNRVRTSTDVGIVSGRVAVRTPVGLFEVVSNCFRLFCEWDILLRVRLLAIGDGFERFFDCLNSLPEFF